MEERVPGLSGSKAEPAHVVCPGPPGWPLGKTFPERGRGGSKSRSEPRAGPQRLASQLHIPGRERKRKKTRGKMGKPAYVEVSSLCNHLVSDRFRTPRQAAQFREPASLDLGGLTYILLEVYKYGIAFPAQRWKRGIAFDRGFANDVVGRLGEEQPGTAGGSLTSRPTWSNASGRSATSASSVLGVGGYSH